MCKVKIYNTSVNVKINGSMSKKIKLFETLRAQLLSTHIVPYPLPKNVGLYKLIFTHPKTSTWGYVNVNEKQLHSPV